MCVCERERERQRDSERGGGERDREREREREERERWGRVFSSLNGFRLTVTIAYQMGRAVISGLYGYF